MINASQDIHSIQMSPSFAEAMNDLRTFLFDRVYIDSVAKTEDEKAKKVLQALFFHYLDHPEELPSEFQPSECDELSVRVCDYIAGMTDRYALRKYEDLFIPKTWMV
jgi:dGTPase